jgi:hypothetical protein
LVFVETISRFQISRKKSPIIDQIHVTAAKISTVLSADFHRNRKFLSIPHGIFVSVISKTPTTAALFGFLAFAVLQILTISSDLAPYNPAGSTTIANEILANSFDLSTIWIPMLVTSLSTVILFLVTYIIFRRQEI